MRTIAAAELGHIAPDPAIVSVSPTGFARFLAPGLTTIEARIDDVAAIMDISVTPVAAPRVLFLADSPTVAVGTVCAYPKFAPVPFSEDDPIRQPISPYAATKGAGELLCHTYSHLYGLRCVCLRFFTVYGPRQRPDLAIHKFAKLISQRKPIPVFGDGTTRRDYTYIDDIIDGITAAIHYNHSDYDIFNLGESRTVELNELISILEKELGTHAIIDRQPSQPGDVPQTYADISKARAWLHYDPKTQIEVGLRRFVEWFGMRGL